MPYITKKERELRQSGNILTQGELNYRITSLCIQYLETNGLHYSVINEVVGALECAKLEFYRRVAIPYEDKKIKENGDIEGYANSH